MADKAASTDAGQPDSPEGGPMPSIVELVHEHSGRLYRYAFRLTGRAADAEDLVQQTLLVAQQKLSQVRRGESVTAWLLTVLRNAFLKSVQRRRPIGAADLELDVATIPDPATLEDDDIDREQLQAALAELPEEFRVVLLMFYFEDRSYRDIAEVLDVPLGTVMSRLSRAKGHLRARLLRTAARRD